MRISALLNWRCDRIAKKTRLSARQITGTAVFLGGLKNGRGTTFAETVCRTASTVISMLSVVPAAECSRFTHASAIIFFSVGDHVVDVALPTCRPLRYTGRSS